jgi:putative ABC transport system ATP-binding protein
MELLEQLNKSGTTICMVTHDPRYADMATTKVQLLDGTVLQAQLSQVAV